MLHFNLCFYIYFALSDALLWIIYCYFVIGWNSFRCEKHVGVLKMAVFNSRYCYPCPINQLDCFTFSSSALQFIPIFTFKLLGFYLFSIVFSTPIRNISILFSFEMCKNIRNIYFAYRFSMQTIFIYVNENIFQTPLIQHVRINNVTWIFFLRQQLIIRSELSNPWGL